MHKSFFNFHLVLVESLFGIMNYNTCKTRSSLNDKTLGIIIHTRDVHDNTSSRKLSDSFSDNKIELCIDDAFEHKLI